VLIAIAAMSWGTTGSVTTILVADASAGPLLIGAVRVWLAAALLVAGAWWTTRALAMARRDVAHCIAMGACMAAFQAAYFSAVIMTGVAVAALIAICSAPIMIAALAAAFLGERLTRRVRGALVLGVAGTAGLIAGPGVAADVSPRFLAGAALALTAGLAYALYLVIAKSSLSRTPPLPLAAANFTAAAILLSPALVLSDDPLAQITRGWPGMLYLGVVATAGAYALYTIGLRSVPASMAAVVALLEPLTATLLGVLVFDERLGTLGVAGAVLLLAAIALLIAARPASSHVAS
jgi:DME family drug/metabolite transporter